MSPARIVDLTAFSGIPTGQEIMELSQGGAGSFAINLGTLSSGRQATTVSSGGTTNVTAAQYGDVLVTTTSAVTVQLPTAVSRSGVPVSIVALQTTTPNITILPNGLETIIGRSSVTITNSYGAFTLWPSTGVGWYQK